MKKVFVLVWSLTLLLVFFGSYSYADTFQENPEAARVQIEESFGKLPLSFIENRGQANEKVTYYLQGTQGTIYFTREGIVYDLFAEKDSGMREKVLQTRKAPSARLSRLSFTIKPKGARKDMKLAAEERLPSWVNYLTGNNPGTWHVNIPVYKSIVYEGLYQGIDLKVYGTNNQMEYDFIVHPGGNPKDIELSCEGINGLEIDRDGNLLIKTVLTEVKHLQPTLYQEINGKRRPVEGSFQVAQNTFAFEVKEYDKDYPLIIDPLTLSYSTYLGGSGHYDWGFGIAVDSSGNSYVTGAATGHDFPLQNAYQETWVGGTEVFVTKLNSSGTGLFYSTFLGGRENDYGYGIAVDSSGNAYVTGKTFSANDFPLENAYQETFGGGNTDAFVAKFNPSGGLSYSTYLGGSNYDSGQGIAVDSSGKACVIGETRSSDFPVQNAYQETLGGYSDAFITKFDPYGSGLSYSTYLGGSSSDYGYGIAVDSSGNCYATGEAESSDFPVQNAYQEAYRGNGDAFVTKLDPYGIGLLYSTYLGGSGGDVGRGIAVDPSGSAYVTGETSSASYLSRIRIKRRQEALMMLSSANSIPLEAGFPIPPTWAGAEVITAMALRLTRRETAM